jgi:hypothetical protein
MGSIQHVYMNRTRRCKEGLGPDPHLGKAAKLKLTCLSKGAHIAQRSLSRCYAYKAMP